MPETRSCAPATPPGSRRATITAIACRTARRAMSRCSKSAPASPATPPSIPTSTWSRRPAASRPSTPTVMGRRTKVSRAAGREPFLTRLDAHSSLSFKRDRFIVRARPPGEAARGRRRKAMAFEFGMFHEFQRTAGITDEECFKTSFEEVDAAERWGLDAMWLAEIHVNPERSVCSAPLTLASAIAARTKRMKVGTGVQVLPLCHPLRLAEEAATVDQISHGRLIFGIGRSGFPRTYEAYGVPYGESRERFAETLEILKR